MVVVAVAVVVWWWSDMKQFHKTEFELAIQVLGSVVNGLDDGVQLTHSLCVHFLNVIRFPLE